MCVGFPTNKMSNVANLHIAEILTFKRIDGTTLADGIYRENRSGKGINLHRKIIIFQLVKKKRQQHTTNILYFDGRQFNPRIVLSHKGDVRIYQMRIGGIDREDWHNDTNQSTAAPNKHVRDLHLFSLEKCNLITLANPFLVRRTFKPFRFLPRTTTTTTRHHHHSHHQKQHDLHFIAKYITCITHGGDAADGVVFARVSRDERIACVCLCVCG